MGIPHIITAAARQGNSLEMDLRYSDSGIRVQGWAYTPGGQPGDHFQVSGGVA